MSKKVKILSILRLDYTFFKPLVNITIYSIFFDFVEQK